MTIDLSDVERRLASAFILEIWRSEFKRLRRRPEPFEVTIAARVAAEALVRRGQGDHFNVPRLARSPLFRLLGNGGSSYFDVAPDIAEQAATALRYLNAVGDNPKSTAASTEVDRRVFDAATAMFRNTGRINDSEIGRHIGVSHTQARDRKIGRGARIAAALHRDCPDLWEAQGRPRTEKIIAPGKGATVWRQAA